ncbi:hypothetical protein VKT23_019250 [Stygiomarasmius scandens]|uniref:Uncharacterized protein n=1 Tax=Marasmiellus scandens TaxID=2682957 RepID=A0ABR1IPR9_9AGAR
MKHSELFPPQPGTDVVFQSSDGVLFHLNPKHLEYGAEAFPPSAILEPLFQFTSPRNQPDLEDLNFKTLMELAEAAEKYVVYSAIRTCVMKMKDFIPTNTWGIFLFASKHDHEALLFSIAPRFLNKPLVDMAYVMPLSLYIPWTFYHEQWTKTIDKINNGLTMTNTARQGDSDTWRLAIRWVRDNIISQPLELGNFQKLFQLSGYSCCSSTYCCSQFINWRNEMVYHISTMRDFKSFVKEHKARKGQS